MNADKQAALIELDCDFPGLKKGHGQVRIVSDGTASGSRVYNTFTGEDIPFAYKVEWSCDVDTGLAQAKIFVKNVSIDVQGRITPSADSDLTT